MNRRILILAAAALLATTSVNAGESDYPNKPIRMIVPYAAGGVTDVISRAVANQMAKQLNQPVVVENRTGAGGNIGTDLIAKSTPDGYVVGIATNGPMAANKTLYSSLNYDPEKDFSPVTLLFSIPYLLFVHPSVEADNIHELISLVKANPGKYNYAHGGVGTAQYFAGERFVSMAGVKLGSIAYRGEAPAVVDVLGGHVPIGIASYTSVGPHLATGSLRVLAVTSKQRSALLTKVPTLDESGLTGYEVQPWFGLAGPAGMPADVIQKLHAAAVASLTSSEVSKAVTDIGGATVSNSPQEFSDFISSEIPRWAAMAKESGAKIE
ncbi:Bug family tripartite tricarboxylate transporter substrate binding protein [Pollutimonas nitritireducens]|nr:tripartite tricarboxylate transporter substrate binding protein [Pollutimonas nitritireducens]